MSIIDYIDLYLGSLLNMIFCVIIVKKVFGIKMIENKTKMVENEAKIIKKMKQKRQKHGRNR